VLAVHCGEFGFNVTYRRSQPIQCVLKASNPHCVQSNIITADRQTVAPTSTPLRRACLAFRCVSAIDSNGRTIWIADAHRDGQRFVVRADEKLTALMELESAIRGRIELS
jgi:hypothetical protein